MRNEYARAVRESGNEPARRMLTEIFEVVPRKWRGIGEIPTSGWRLRAAYRSYDAALKFDVAGIETQEPEVCRAGEVLQGLIKPHECSAFGTSCTPRSPLGATMVSSEGACAAYYRYGRFRATSEQAPAAETGSPAADAGKPA